MREIAVMVAFINGKLFQIVPDGIAAKSGKLRMGDRILSVNGEEIASYTHQEAVMALLKPADEITLNIQHDPLPEGFEVMSTDECILR